MTDTTIPDVDHIQYRTNVAEESYSEMLQQFQSPTNIVKLAMIIATMKQVLDNAVIAVGKLRRISTASGVVLDNIGEELGVPRDDLDDDSYRILLSIRGYKSNTAGTRPQVVDILSRLSGTPETSMHIYTGKPKSVDIGFYEGCMSIADAVNEITDILPILSNYRLLSLAGTPIGFSSVHDESGTTYPFLGFGSVHDTGNTYGVGGGHLGSLVGASS